MMTVYEEICASDSAIYYKLTEYSDRVSVLQPEQAREMYEKDLDEMIKVFSYYGLDAEKAKKATEDIWRKHLYRPRAKED